MKRLPYVICLLLLLMLFQALSIVEMSRPTNFLDPQNSSVNESFAFDSSTTTFALLNNTGNLSFLTYTNPGYAAIVDVKQVDLRFDIAATDLSDDQWALQYSNDSGSSWYDLRALAAGNQSRTTLQYDDVQGPNGDWNWSSIRDALRVRVQYDAVGGADGASIRLYETWANVTTDVEGPNIPLLSPPNRTNYSGITLVNFSYNVTDALSGVASCDLLLNGALNQTNSSPTEGGNNTFAVSLDDGSYNWTVRCTDNASHPNQNTSFRRVVTVDNAPPTLSLLSPSNGATLTNGSFVSLTFSYADRSQLSNCSLYLNGTLDQTINATHLNWPTGTGEFVIFAPNGLWLWNVTCTDIHGRANSSATFNFTQNANDPPSIVVNIPATTTLSLGSNVTVGCNGTVTDLQGSGTLDTVTAYLHREDWEYDHADETSGHHTNASCATTAINGTTDRYECNFTLPYYARAMPWICTFRAVDEQDFETFATNTTIIQELYAFNLTPAAIAYGILEAGATSTTDQVITVTNLGNAELDVGVDGYAVADGDGLALSCDFGNTSLDGERYHTLSGTAFSSMTPLTDTTTQVDELNLPPRNDTFNGTANLYWKLQMGIPSRGNCSGFVTFTGLPS